MLGPRRGHAVFVGLLAAALLASAGWMLHAWRSGGVQWEAQVWQGPVFDAAIVAIIAGWTAAFAMNSRRPTGPCGPKPAVD